MWSPISSGIQPARSIASQPTSISNRCCGSTHVASRGEIPKNSGSICERLSRNTPRRAYILPGTSGSSSKKASMSQRSSGMSPTRSSCRISDCQNFSGVSAVFGKRHAIETTAIGSAVPSLRAPSLSIAASCCLSSRIFSKACLFAESDDDSVIGYSSSFISSTNACSSDISSMSTRSTDLRCGEGSVEEAGWVVSVA